MTDTITLAEKQNSVALIEVASLQKTFGSRRVLNVPELIIHDGDMVALLGPSGSGKSTLLRHLSGLITSDTNDGSEIRICGNRIQSAGKLSKNIRKHRRSIGLIFQQFNLVRRMSTLDNVLVGALGQTSFLRTFTKQFTKAQKKKAMAALARVGMESFAYQRVSTLSGGQQQRVAIARALMQGAEVILADEPIASLDPKSSRVVMQMLQNICKEDGLTVVVTLHQVDYALEFCERVVALQDGEIFYDGAANALSEKDIQRLYKSEEAEHKANLGNLANETSATETAPTAAAVEAQSA